MQTCQISRILLDLPSFQLCDRQAGLLLDAKWNAVLTAFPWCKAIGKQANRKQEKESQAQQCDGTWLHEVEGLVVDV